MQRRRQRRKRKTMLNKIKLFWNRYGTWIVNIGYIIGLAVAIDTGFILWYFLITTILFGVIYRKALWKIMQFFAGYYVYFCRKSSSKFNPYTTDTEKAKLLTKLEKKYTSGKMLEPKGKN